MRQGDQESGRSRFLQPGSCEPKCSRRGAFLQLERGLDQGPIAPFRLGEQHYPKAQREPSARGGR